MENNLVVDRQNTSPIYVLRERKRNEVINLLREDANRLRASDRGLQLWLIGSYAVGNWDTFSDIDVVCVSDVAYAETDFKTSDQYPMDIFSLNDVEFKQRLSGDIFNQSISKGVKL